MELLKYIKINNHTIELEKNKQLFFYLIYSLKLIKLKILKTYIKVNQTNNFIQSSKSPVRVLILFD